MHKAWQLENYGQLEREAGKNVLIRGIKQTLDKRNPIPCVNVKALRGKHIKTASRLIMLCLYSCHKRHRCSSPFLTYYHCFSQETTNSVSHGQLPSASTLSTNPSTCSIFISSAEHWTLQHMHHPTFVYSIP